MLRWAYEGAAFREMDRFAFDAAFPHHARAAALMGQALVEAEKLDAAESERFLHRARENIAQRIERIERGDMARIAPGPLCQPKPNGLRLEQKENRMPTRSQKIAILARAGVAVPTFPSRDVPDQDRRRLEGNRAPQKGPQGDAQHDEAVVDWSKQVDDLFATYAMSRAARSLREAEEAQQLSQLRNANAQLG